MNRDGVVYHISRADRVYFGAWRQIAKTGVYLASKPNTQRAEREAKKRVMLSLLESMR